MKQDNIRIIKDCPKYSVTRAGIIINNKTGVALKVDKNQHGYLRVGLYQDINGRSVAKKYGVHRLVAATFLPNPKKYDQVNHIDGDKTNNAVDNLEWTDSYGNMTHAVNTGLTKNNVPVMLYNKDTRESKGFRSIEQLASYLKVPGISLIPNIKYSKKYPFMGKYVMTLDETLLLNRPKSDKLGSAIWVYDSVTNVRTEYASMYVASYVTGIHNIRRLLLAHNNVLNTLGYIISPVADLIDNKVTDDKHKIIKDRVRYRSTAYVSVKDLRYDVYDYVNKEVSTHMNVHALIAEINLRSPVLITKVAEVTTALVRSIKANQTGLVRGFGIRRYNKNETPIPWTPRSEGVLICSRHGRLYTTPVFRINIGSTDTRIVIGVAELVTYLLQYMTPSQQQTLPKRVTHLTTTEILNRISRDDVKIEKLDKVVYS